MSEIERKHKIRPDTLTRARELRRPQTPAERLLWAKLRDRQLGGLKFHRQHPVGSYIVDFCCAAQRLIIELDGDSHTDQAQYDRARSTSLSNQGYRIMRFSNNDVYDHIYAVLETIVSSCNATDGKESSQ